MRYRNIDFFTKAQIIVLDLGLQILFKICYDF